MKNTWEKEFAPTIIIESEKYKKQADIIMPFLEAYWEELKPKISNLLATQKQSLIAEFKKSFYETMESLSNSMYKNCLKGKNSPLEVSEKNWQDSSKSFDELWQEIRDKLNQLKE